MATTVSTPLSSTMPRVTDLVPAHGPAPPAVSMKSLNQQEAFVKAQADALHAYQMAKALKLSKETAASEALKRKTAHGAAATGPPSVSASSSASAPLANYAGSKPIPIPASPAARGTGQGATQTSRPNAASSPRGPAALAATPVAEDALIARSLARSWRVDDIQKSLLVDPSFSPPKPNVVATIPKQPSTPTKSTSASTSIVTPKHTPQTKRPAPLHTTTSPASRTTSQVNSIPVNATTYHYSTTSTATTSVPKVSFALTPPSTPRHERWPSNKMDTTSSRDSDRRQPSSSSAAPLPITPIGTPPPTPTKRWRRPSLSITNTPTKISSSYTPKPLLAVSPPKNSPIPPNSAASRPSTPTKVSKAPSSQDLHQGLMMNPADTLPGPASSIQGPSDSATIAAPTSIPVPAPEYTNIFTRSHPCSACNTLMVSPRGSFSVLSDGPQAAQQFAELLHVVCPKCTTKHCRGCFSPVSCSPVGPFGCVIGLGTSSSSMSARGQCAVRDCCAGVSVIAIFEALSSFDLIYINEAVSNLEAAEPPLFTSEGADHIPPNKSERQAFLKQLITRPDKATRKLEDAFVKTSRTLCSWLQKSSFPSDMADVVTDLFSTSLFLEVLHTFLTHTGNAKDWISHSDAYIAVLETLKKMYDADLKNLLNAPLPSIEYSRGLGQWVWDASLAAATVPLGPQSFVPASRLFDEEDEDEEGGYALEDYFRIPRSRSPSASSPPTPPPASTIPCPPLEHSSSSSSTSSASSCCSSTSSSTTASDLTPPSSVTSSSNSLTSSSPRTPCLRLSDDPVTHEPLHNAPLCDLIQQLEAHRKPLLALMGKVQFMVTLEKINMLCDGISYLLMQQVVNV